jgi:hypothetical protein
MSYSNRFLELARRYTGVARIGVVIVNLSDTSFSVGDILKLRPSVRLSASRARSYGYCNSYSKFIVFLDDDALISVELLDKRGALLEYPLVTSRT